MQKTQKNQIEIYLKLLEQRLDGPLFSEERMPGIRKAVRIPTFRRDEIQSEKDFLDLVEGLKADTKTWMHENQFQKIRLECIRKAVATLGNKHLIKLWNHKSLKIDDQEKLKILIDKKLKHTRRHITVVRAAITTLLWSSVVILCVLLLGAPLFAIKSFYATIKESSLDAHTFLNSDFDTKANDEFETLLEPYLREINAAKNKLDADKNLAADNKQNILATNRNVMLTHIFPLLEEKDYKTLSVASRLLRNIIYTDPNKRYYHTPTPTVSKLPAKQILISWPDANLVKETDNLTLGTITYTIEGTDGSTGIFSIKPMYKTQAGKISDTHFWIYDSRNLLVVNRKTGEQQEILNKDLKKAIKKCSIKIHIIGVEENSNIFYFTSQKLSGEVTQYYCYNLDYKALYAISNKNLIGKELITPNGKNMTLSKIRTFSSRYYTGEPCQLQSCKLMPWKTKYDLPLLFPLFIGEPLFLKDGRIILDTREGIILYTAVDPNETITLKETTYIEPIPITTLAKPGHFLIALHKKRPTSDNNTILFTITKDETIAAIIYYKQDSKHTAVSLILQIYSIESLTTLNFITVDWNEEKDGDPKKIYFNEKNNICIEGQNKLITYPYGDQAEVYEVDRKNCLGIL